MSDEYMEWYNDIKLYDAVEYRKDGVKCVAVYTHNVGGEPAYTMDDSTPYAEGSVVAINPVGFITQLATDDEKSKVLRSLPLGTLLVRLGSSNGRSWVEASTDTALSIAGYDFHTEGGLSYTLDLTQQKISKTSKNHVSKCYRVLTEGERKRDKVTEKPFDGTQGTEWATPFDISIVSFGDILNCYNREKSKFEPFPVRVLAVVGDIVATQTSNGGSWTFNKSNGHLADGGSRYTLCNTISARTEMSYYFNENVEISDEQVEKIIGILKADL